MGRKPNALILTHFERGEKLSDASNRYAHTCRHCGERFPKGRIDTLTTHLVKRCPAISLRDKQKALLELNNLSDVSDPSRNRNGDVQMNGPTVELPIGNRNWTALETLAEVSRQIGVGENGEPQPADGSGADNRNPEQQRTNPLELREQYTLDNPPVSYEQRIQRDKKLVGLKNVRRQSEASLSPNFAAHLSNSRSTSPNLAMAASSIAAAAAARFVPSMVDPAILADESNGHENMDGKSMTQDLHAPISDNFFNSNQEHHGPWDILDGTGGNLYPDPDHMSHSIDSHETPRPGQYPRLAMNPTMTTEFSTEYGNGNRPDKPKVRGRFTPARRKEVQEVRKMGACIRCKMLKKPCSGGTPCNTCKSVESARLWKQPCLRTRIAEEVEMFSAGLHAVLAYHEVNAFKNQAQFRKSPHLIEASHYPETTVFATINALEGQNMSLGSHMDPGLSRDFNMNTFRILDNETDDLPVKMEAYMKRMMSVFFEREQSDFMRVTLATAFDISIEKQDSLLTRVLELWAMVHILIDHEVRWSISVRIDADAPSGQGIEIPNDPNSDGSYNLICLQLNAAAEKKAAQICKDVLNELERRLLARSSATPFATFLIAIIFLNCIEKSTWLFESWEQESFKPRWPLDKPPKDYAVQGDKITNMLQMLLRMRSVPPKTEVKNGIIEAKGDQAALEYFKKVKLSDSYIRQQQMNKVLDKANSRSYELHFCSRLLLPLSSSTE